MRKIITTIAAYLIAAHQAYPQKLPNKQPGAVRAPDSVKIDGKASEWGGFKAYNTGLLAYYTLANDDQNLYLVVHINKPHVINKAISGAITLTVNNTGKQKDEGYPAVTFPLFRFQPGTKLRANLNSPIKATDSLLFASNAILSDSTKVIRFSDITAITDTIKGTYTDKRAQFRGYPLYEVPGGRYIVKNSSQIKTAASFEGRWKYTYELAIPLKYLRVTPGKIFSYNIRFNGPMYKTKRPTAGFVVTYALNGGTATQLDLDLTEPTDVWGEYILAEK
ncbi:hypothetical protein [Mucilaginibacter myungsuensis]|uniref:Uncharacterized protein n=1 Tax=Mucilaginibacter myungsuensis TaxID=649104 RepID=A0A929KTR7_9SPHI|nr:hypothetical protein [Mucilaginibacter myungsuensis]MBE9661389.1 hypothetical protein [Mucilaginibacter myungsuensis]MDN3597532.1 hypothetical protein [Mucilaginibacter myungsuensis]